MFCFKEIILNEIAAEGLEGSTLECLWENLNSFEYFQNLDDSHKEYLWKSIRNLEEIDFFLLSEPRECNFKYQNRTSQYSYDKEYFVENNIPMFQCYPIKLVMDKNVFGSCSTYDSRISINNAIKQNEKYDYQYINETHGNRLILVASQDYRMAFLGLNKKQIKPNAFALLEYIGRSRSNGIKAVGSTSCLEFIKDSRILWYLKKKLKSQNLIKIQHVNFMNNGGIRQVTVFHINRYYRPLYNFFEINMEKLFIYMADIQSIGILKSTFHEVLQFSEKFLNKAKQLKWLEILMTSYRKLHKNCEINDEKLLQSYINDFRLSPNESHSLSLVDSHMCYVRPIKTWTELTEKNERLALVYENDDDPTQSVVLTKNEFCRNFEDPLDIQVLRLLAKQPMNNTELKKAFNLTKVELRGLIKLLLKNQQIIVNHVNQNRNSVPYFAINDRLDPTLSLEFNDDNLPLESSEINDSCSTTIARIVNQSQVNSSFRNPKRQERYSYLTDIIRQHKIITGYCEAQKLLRDWEKSRDYKEIMDRRSFYRIIEEGIKDRAWKVIEVEFQLNTRKVREKWIVMPGISRNDPLFQEKYRDFQDKMNDIKQHIVLKNYKMKMKKTYIRGINYNSSINILKLVRNVEYDDEVVGDFVFPELPPMLKRKLFHEFIWYVSIGSHQEPNINIQEIIDERGFRVYLNTSDWNRHVAPLQQDTDEQFITFNINDIVLRIPLCLFCIFIVPKKCNKELLHCLMDENLRLATMENLAKSHLPVVSFLINHRKKNGMRKLFELVEALIDMGLITKRDQKRTVIHKEKAFFFLNREVFLTDTSKAKLPIADELIWMRFPRYQWLLKSKVDVVNYWENIYSVCTNTPCTKAIYRPNGLMILSSESHELMRNSEYIAENVLCNGPVELHNIDKFKQFGASLPNESIRWKSLGPGGFFRSLTSWNILNWCQNRFDKSCNKMAEQLGMSFKQFRITLFTDITKSLKSYEHITSLNESLSLILHEVNIIFTAAFILNYDDDLEDLWKKIKNKKWFKTSFLNIHNLNYQLIIRYISMLSTDHEIERENLISSHNEGYSKLLSEKQQNDGKEGCIIHFVVMNLFKNHSFIPQWNTMNTNLFATDHLVPVAVSPEEKPEENNSQFIDILRINKNLDDVKKVTFPDKIETVSDIIELQLAKYMICCMHAFSEPIEPNLVQRNKIFKQYSSEQLINVINRFSNFYILEPLKMTPKDVILSGTLEKRLSKFEMRLLNRGQTESNQEIFLRTYRDWADSPSMDKYQKEDGIRLNYDLDTCEWKHVMNMMSVYSAMDEDIENDSKNTVSMNLTKFSFDDTNYNSKSVCQSSYYKVNLKNKNLGDIDWDSITKDVKISINLHQDTYNMLYENELQAEIWEELSKFIFLPEDPLKSVKRRKFENPNETILKSIKEFISNGMYAGRNYSELKLKFSGIPTLVQNLQDLIKDQQIHLLGTNTYHFVSKEYIRCWLIKASELEKEPETQPKRRKRCASPETITQYFFPEFYRDEVGNFKPNTFIEMINRLFIKACRNAGCTLEFLIKDLSVILGEVVIRKLINVLYHYGVIDLRMTVMQGSPEKGGPFTKRPIYEMIDFDPFDQENEVTVVVKPVGHMKMCHLLTDIETFFQTDIQKHITKTEQRNNLN